ncbi:MAG TPA: hypothetical protein ENI89_01615 [Desulfobulbus sp.]|nr:hypothetical protein [Desulfobulbus sp.]
MERFLSSLVDESKVSASTRRQALIAWIFLNRRVLFVPPDNAIAPIRSKEAGPSVLLSCDEEQRLFLRLGWTHLLMAKLLHGSGLR